MDFAIVWVVLAVFTAVIDNVTTYRRYTGKLGQRVRNYYRHHAALVGGVRNLVILGTLCDLVFWPLGLAVCLYVWRRDWCLYQDELQQQ